MLEGDRKRRLLDLIEKSDITENEIKEAKNLFKEAGAIEASKDLANKYYNEAKASLDKLSNFINDSEQEFYLDTLNFVINRNF